MLNKYKALENLNPLINSRDGYWIYIKLAGYLVIRYSAKPDNEYMVRFRISGWKITDIFPIVRIIRSDTVYPVHTMPKK